ncbi:OLC1v1019303C1 [Oldenlandia corymbosa var. corymbosa]|uniref:OLC1v1019303C1 n=1 Tax=Oldenlandia corymbosa var. corymbosa TaxID=529605 RepID=A0AAV1EE08_OLDCO|nr:OLC1v1019303C1 [Oldenlandia corymbosa var. corymbosa]
MSFTETVRLKVYWNTTYTTEPDGTITVHRDAPDGYLIIDRMFDFSELVDKVCGVMEVDRDGLYIDFSLVWTERSGKKSRVHINDDNTVRFIYLCADKWPELYPENVKRIGHVYTSTSGQDTVPALVVVEHDDEYVPSDEDSDDDTNFESSSSVPYVFDDISEWDKTLEEVDCDGIKMWDGNPLTLGLDVHFINKPEAQAAVGEWNLVHGRTFRVKTSSKRTWYVECETCGPKYPKERLHSYDCLWKARVSLQKATGTWKMVKCQNVLPPKPMKLYEEDVRSLSIKGHRTFDADSFGYDRLGEVAQVAERALSVNATNVVRHDLDRHVEVNDILSQQLAPVDPTQQHPPPRPPRRSRRSQRGCGGQETIAPTQPHQCSQHQQSHIPFTEGSSHQSPLMSPHYSSQHSSHQSPHSPHHSSHQSPHQSPHHSSPTQQAFYRPIMSPQHQQSHFAFTQFSSPQTSQPQFGDAFIDFSGIRLMTQAEDADQDDQFEGQGHQRHEEQGSSQTLGTPPLAVSKGQRVMKEPDRLTYSHFQAKKLKKK